MIEPNNLLGLKPLTLKKNNLLGFHYWILVPNLNDLHIFEIISCKNVRESWFYQGILDMVVMSGTSRISPTPVRLVPSAGPSIKESIAIDA